MHIISIKCLKFAHKSAKTPFWPRYSTYWGKIARSSSSLHAMFILFPCFYLLCSYRWPRFTSLIDYQRIIWLKSHLKESDPANSRCCEYLHKVRDGRRLFFSIYIFLVFFYFCSWVVTKEERYLTIATKCQNQNGSSDDQEIWKIYESILNHHLSQD